jgi:hypothetical protein
MPENKFCCDECGKEITEAEYSDGAGLCEDCNEEMLNQEGINYDYR